MNKLHPRKPENARMPELNPEVRQRNRPLTLIGGTIALGFLAMQAFAQDADVTTRSDEVGVTIYEGIDFNGGSRVLEQAETM